MVGVEGARIVAEEGATTVAFTVPGVYSARSRIR
jgi:hypothetical protein